MLARATAVIHQHLQPAVTLTYSLIPETGGIPQMPPILEGALLAEEQLEGMTAITAYTGALGDLIRYGQPYYETKALAWSQVRPDSDLPRFLQQENIQAFASLPIGYKQSKLALLLLAYRRPQKWPQDRQKLLEACSLLIGTCLAEAANWAQHKDNRVATAHTLYGNIANILKGRLDALEGEVMQAFGAEVPLHLVTHLEKAKEIAFEGMRNLVIEAAGDLLVDLEKMSLHKALHTTAVALQRAWPPRQTVQIDIDPIPQIIEQQPLPLRKLLYTLVLEGLGNAVKHGGPAPYIHVGMRWRDNQIYIQIIDHGCGFEQAARPFSPYGLGYWQQYVKNQLGGDFHVSSQPGFGTVINVQIPILPTRSE
jgi:nitrate/nitrite-specific signal transduction histidine kinase